MSNKNKKNIGVFAGLFVLVAAIVAAFNIPKFTFLPEGIRSVVSEFINTYFSKSIISAISLKSILAAVIALVVTWIVANFVKYFISCLKFKNTRAETLRMLLKKIIVYLIYIIGIIVALGCFGVNTTAILVSAGIIGIIVGFGAQSLIEDVITGLFIVLEGEFGIGDIITIDGFRGEVKSIGLRTVSIIDVGGNIRIINNSEISSLVNLSDVTSVAVVTVPASYRDSLKDVEAAVQEALSELPDEYPDIFKEAPVYKGVDDLVETHIELMVVAEVSEENIYNARRIIQREIRYSFEKANLSVPYEEG